MARPFAYLEERNPMSLATLVSEHTRTSANPCKTCVLLGRMTIEDRADFASLAQVTAAEVLARAVSDRLAELGIKETVGGKAVRRHVQEAHA